MSCDPCAKGQLNLTGGLADGKKPEDFDAQGLLEGTQHEMEHTGDPKVAQRIAMDHLTEDKEYYRKLKKIETTKSVRGYVKSSLDKSSLDKSHPVVRRITVQELPISIETDKGQYREWYDPRARKSGKTLMKYPYGYIRGTHGADGQQIDCFIGPELSSKKVFVVHQLKGPDFKKWDEDKVMLGFESLREARAAYLMHYDNPKYLGSVSETDIATFKQSFVQKSLLSGMPDMGPADMQVPPTESMMPMMPGMGMMGMGPPPIDPETYEGVNALLGRIGGVKDPELMQIASEIWGSAYTFEGQQPEQARSEIIGFLLDQRDLLGVEPAQPNFEPSPSLPTADPSGSSDYYNVSNVSPAASTAQPLAGSLYGAVSQTPP